MRPSSSPGFTATGKAIMIPLFPLLTMLIGLQAPRLPTDSPWASGGGVGSSLLAALVLVISSSTGTIRPTPSAPFVSLLMRKCLMSSIVLTARLQPMLQRESNTISLMNLKPWKLSLFSPLPFWILFYHGERARLFCPLTMLSPLDLLFLSSATWAGTILCSVDGVHLGVIIRLLIMQILVVGGLPQICHCFNPQAPSCCLGSMAVQEQPSACCCWPA